MKQKNPLEEIIIIISSIKNHASRFFQSVASILAEKKLIIALFLIILPIIYAIYSLAISLINYISHSHTPSNKEKSKNCTHDTIDHILDLLDSALNSNISPTWIITIAFIAIAIAIVIFLFKKANYKKTRMLRRVQIHNISDSTRVCLICNIRPVASYLKLITSSYERIIITLAISCAISMTILLTSITIGPQETIIKSQTINYLASAPTSATPSQKEKVNNDENSNPKSVTWENVVIECLMILCGTALIGSARNKVKMFSGGFLILSGIALHGFTLINGKINFNQNINAKGTINASGTVNVNASGAVNVNASGTVNAPPGGTVSASDFGPKKILTIQGFETGKAIITPEMKYKINQACIEWRTNLGSSNKGALLIIGSTDRNPLSTPIKKIYESNSGLARARAEEVKLVLKECRIPAEQMITLDSGPTRTPSTKDFQNQNDFPEDRSVSVWAFWNIPKSAGSIDIKKHISAN